MTEPLDHDPSSETTITPTPAIPPAEAAAPAQAEAAVTAAPAAPVTPATAPLGEPTPPVVTAPVSPDGVAVEPPRKRGRLRWAAAAAVIAVVVLVSAAAAFVLTSGASTAAILGYVPADSVAYGELRLDLPGDQKQAVGQFLSTFPGFKDQAALDTKLDEVLDRLVAEASTDEQTFTKDIKPWFDGEIGFAVGALPAATELTDPAKAAADTRALVLLSIKDAALAQTWFEGVLTESGTTSTTQTYDGVELTVASEPSMPGAQGAFGIVNGKVAVIGDLASVHAAIDTDGTSGLAGDPAFDAATAAIDADHLGFVYVHLRSILDRVMAAAPTTDGPAVSASMLALVPDWVATGFRVEDDALVLDAIAPHNAEAPGPDTNHANGVADWAPPTTIVMAAANDYGATLRETIALYRQDPALKDAFTSVDQAAGLLGGLDAALAWIGDAGVVVNQDGTAIEGGLVAIPTDSAAATQFLTTIRGIASLGGATAGITVRDETYGDATITVIDLGSPQDLVGMAGALSGGNLPTDPSMLPLPSGDIEIAYAVTDKVVVIGSGPDFVKSVLDAGAGASLADDARFASLVDRVGKEHTSLTFVDIAAIRGLVEGMMASVPGVDRTEYETSIQPFLAPFDAAVAANSVGTDVDTSRFVITVK
jgi:Protein of unknown function (DUF3352)